MNDKFVGFLFTANIHIENKRFSYPVTIYLLKDENYNPPIDSMKNFRNFQYIMDR